MNIKRRELDKKREKFARKIKKKKRKREWEERESGKEREIAVMRHNALRIRTVDNSRH